MNQSRTALSSNREILNIYIYIFATVKREFNCWLLNWVWGIVKKLLSGWICFSFWCIVHLYSVSCVSLSFWCIVIVFTYIQSLTLKILYNSFILKPLLQNWLQWLRDFLLHQCSISKLVHSPDDQNRRPYITRKHQ